MTTRPLTLATLSLALTLIACQASKPNPAAPSQGIVASATTLDAKGGHPGNNNPDPVSFAYTHSGDILTSNHPDKYGSFPLVHTAAGQDRQGGGLNMDDCCGTYQEDIVLDGAFLAAIDPDGVCFPLSGGVYQANFVGPMTSPDGSSIVSTYYFTAFDKTGTNETKYVLDASGSVTSGTFLPGAGGSSIVALTTAAMNTEGRGKGKNGCTGSDLAIEASVVIEHKACEPSDWVPNGGTCSS